MVAWIDTPAGRRPAAIRGASVTLAGLGVAAIGGLIWDPLKWIGGFVALVGATRFLWAYLRPTRTGRLFPPISKDCEGENHEACSEWCRCSCHGCHFSSNRLDGLPLGERETVTRAIEAACPGVRRYRGDLLSRHGSTWKLVEAPEGSPEQFADQRIRLHLLHLEGQGYSLRFDLGYENRRVVQCLDIEARGRNFLPLLERLAGQTGWVIVDEVGASIATHPEKAAPATDR